MIAPMTLSQQDQLVLATADDLVLKALEPSALTFVSQQEWAEIRAAVEQAGGVRQVQGYAKTVLEKAKSFGGNRSAAGSYAARMRWRSSNEGGIEGAQSKAEAEVREKFGLQPSAGSAPAAAAPAPATMSRTQERALTTADEGLSNLTVMTEKAFKDTGLDAQRDQALGEIDKARKVIQAQRAWVEAGGDPKQAQKELKRASTSAKSASTRAKKRADEVAAVTGGWESMRLPNGRVKPTIAVGLASVSQALKSVAQFLSTAARALQ